MLVSIEGNAEHIFWNYHATSDQRPATSDSDPYQGIVKRKVSGFTLIELAIGLVIIGLVLGGILVAQDLIKAAETRNVIKEVEAYKTAINTYRTKFNCIPGDCLRATDIWSGTTNGNNNSLLDQPHESFTFWQQLALAGLIEGEYTGVTGPASPQDAIIGVNVPASKYPNAGYSAFRTYNQDIWAFLSEPGQVIILGAQFTGSITQNRAIDPKATYNIDKKIDDGMPRKGLVRVFDRAVWNHCITGAETIEATYRMDNTQYQCIVLFPITF